MKWEKKRIREIANVYDGPHATPRESSSGNVFLGIKNIRPKGGLDLKEIRYISEGEFGKWTKRVTPSKDDIVLSYEATLHRYAIIPENFLGCLGRRMALVRVNEKEVYYKFIYYTFLSDAWRGFIDANKLTGATVDRISITDFPDYKINLPPLPTQRKIASILSAYDDLIENNLKRIKLLEEKAFLRYKGIVRSEKIVSENKLEDVIQTVKRKPKILKSDYLESGEFPIVDQSTDFIGGYTNDKEAIYEELPMIVFGDHTRILKYINSPFACGADGTQLVKPKNDNVSVAYLYFELISCNLSNYHYARHFKFLKEQVIKLPSEKVMQEYKDETDKIFNLIQVLRLQNSKLREARDILLPKLMNGQIEV
jgi:type I restriction enzyme S subunit